MGNALIALIVQYLPDLIKGAQSVPAILEYVHKTKAHLEQTQEWTPDQEIEFNKYLNDVTNKEHWKSHDNPPQS